MYCEHPDNILRVDWPWLVPQFWATFKVWQDLTGPVSEAIAERSIHMLPIRCIYIQCGNSKSMISLGGVQMFWTCSLFMFVYMVHVWIYLVRFFNIGVICRVIALAHVRWICGQPVKDFPQFDVSTSDSTWSGITTVLLQMSIVKMFVHKDYSKLIVFFICWFYQEFVRLLLVLVSGCYCSTIAPSGHFVDHQLGADVRPRARRGWADDLGCLDAAAAGGRMRPKPIDRSPVRMERQHQMIISVIVVIEVFILGRPEYNETRSSKMFQRLNSTT